MPNFHPYPCFVLASASPLISLFNIKKLMGEMKLLAWQRLFALLHSTHGKAVAVSSAGSLVLALEIVVGEIDAIRKKLFGLALAYYSYYILQVLFHVILFCFVFKLCILFIMLLSYEQPSGLQFFNGF